MGREDPEPEAGRGVAFNLAVKLGIGGFLATPNTHRMKRKAAVHGF